VICQAPESLLQFWRNSDGQCRTTHAPPLKGNPVYIATQHNTSAIIGK
jgi:hypothetical protein